ncbi:MAG: hypothetical protein HC899_08350 [Leptolyngbyaceae cyanobacterium SM1_4_3]|nr:hypothetical protein [Leptolyngbyaceae cyanobacterium SM1_4_3]
MSDPSILLLLTCITCADSTNGFTHLSASDCSTVESFSQSQRLAQPGGKLVNCTHAVSAPEVIPAFLTIASQPAVTIQTTAPERAIAPARLHPNHLFSLKPLQSHQPQTRLQTVNLLVNLKSIHP